MQLRVLGCSGGIGQNLRTSTFLLDDDILLDAGTGVGDLSLDEMRKLQHIFITHSHMDHITSIPLLIDTLFSELQQPLKVHAQPDTIEAMKTHIFNWKIWPDFAELPTKDSPVLEFLPMHPGDVVAIRERDIRMIKVEHTVPAVAYAVTSNKRSMAYTGDTSTNDSLWQALNELPSLELLIIESGFANHDQELARLAKHYCPRLLADDIKKLQHKPKVGISHLKPGEESLIMQECHSLMGDDWDLHQLSSGDVFQI